VSPGDNLLGEDAPSTIDVQIQRLRGARRRVLLLDYDGTLVPIAPVPDLATPHGELLELLRALATLEQTQIHIVSGRARDWMERWLSAVPARLHAEHGFWSRQQDGWAANAPLETAWKPAVVDIAHAWARRAEGALVEEKQTGVAFHYRCVAPAQADALVPGLRAALAPLVASLPIELLDGRCVLEVRPRGVNKGQVVDRLLGEGVLLPGTVLLAAGDDVTDEEMFRRLPGEAITIRVGHGPSEARCRVAGPQALFDHLRRLLA
jgi:trehalose 6-phosphate synthase/phosphatase